MSPLAGTLIAATGIGGKPDPNGLPGSPALEQLVNGLAFWGLLAALVVVLVLHRLTAVAVGVVRRCPRGAAGPTATVGPSPSGITGLVA